MKKDATVIEGLLFKDPGHPTKTHIDLHKEKQTEYTDAPERNTKAPNDALEHITSDSSPLSRNRGRPTAGVSGRTKRRTTTMLKPPTWTWLLPERKMKSGVTLPSWITSLPCPSRGYCVAGKIDSIVSRPVQA